MDIAGFPSAPNILKIIFLQEQNAVDMKSDGLIRFGVILLIIQFFPTVCFFPRSNLPRDLVNIDCFRVHGYRFALNRIYVFQLSPGLFPVIPQASDEILDCGLSLPPIRRQVFLVKSHGAEASIFMVEVGTHQHLQLFSGALSVYVLLGFVCGGVLGRPGHRCIARDRPLIPDGLAVPTGPHCPDVIVLCYFNHPFINRRHLTQPQGLTPKLLQWAT